MTFPPRLSHLDLVGAAASVVAGLALWQSMPRAGHWPFAIVGLALLAGATRGRRGRVGLAFGTLAGLAAFLPSLSWSGVYVGSLPWVALSILEALYVGLTGLVHARLTHGRAARWSPLVLALAWVSGETARSTTPFGGFPWNTLPATQVDSPMLAIVRYAGSSGLTCAVALAAGLLAELGVVAWQARRPAAIAVGGAPSGTPSSSHPSRRRLPARAAALLACLLAVVGIGLVLPVPTDGEGVAVLAVQGNVPTAGLEFNAQRRAVLDHHVDETLGAVAQIAAGTRPQPQLVVWPENASDIDPLRNPDAYAQITRAAVAVKAPLLVGGLRITTAGQVENTSWLWEGAAGPTQSYVKRHPVPFGEYIPFRPFFRLFSDKVDLVRADMVPGTRPGVITVAASTRTPLAVGTSICFDVAYDELMRDDVEHGATLLAVQTNNATFGYTDESYQQLALSRVRAVELGRSVVHVSTVGTSAFVTPDGIAHEQSELFVPARLSMTVPLRTERTPAVVIGAWPGRAGLAITGLLLLAPLTRTVRDRRRTRRGDGARARTSQIDDGSPQGAAPALNA